MRFLKMARDATCAVAHRAVDTTCYISHISVASTNHSPPMHQASSITNHQAPSTEHPRTNHQRTHHPISPAPNHQAPKHPSTQAPKQQNDKRAWQATGESMAHAQCLRAEQFGSCMKQHVSLARRFSTIYWMLSRADPLFDNTATATA